MGVSPTLVTRRAWDLLVDANVAMRTARRGLHHSPVCNPETDATHWLQAIETGNFEQAPDHGRNHNRYQQRPNGPESEIAWTGSNQSSGQKKKSNRAGQRSVAAAHEVLANRHRANYSRLTGRVGDGHVRDARHKLCDSVARDGRLRK